jgi:ribosomal subunit interface protein
VRNEYGAQTLFFLHLPEEKCLETAMESSLQISFKHMDSSGSLEQLIRERTERLSRFHPRIIGCRVVVEVPRRRTASFKAPISVAVEVTVPGHNLIVARSAEHRHEMKNDHTAAVNRAFDAIQRQLVKVSDLECGNVKRHDVMETGVVIEVFPDEGYGFIQVRGSPDLTFTRHALHADFGCVEAGMVVQTSRAPFEGPMGPQASSVKLANARRSL